MVKADEAADARGQQAARAADPSTASGGTLSELIGVEQRLQTAIRDAQAEAEQQLAAARSEIEARDREQDHALEAALRDLAAALDAEKSAALVEIQRRGEEAVRRHLEVDDARVEASAAFVAQRLAEGDLEGDEP